MYAFIGIAIGVTLSVLVPYINDVLNAMSQDQKWPRPTWGLLAKLVAPILGYAVALVITVGLYETVIGWELREAALIGYTGTELMEKGVRIVYSAYRITKK